MIWLNISNSLGPRKVSINLQIILIHSFFFPFCHFLKTLILRNNLIIHTKVKRISWYQRNTDSRFLFSSQNQLSWLTLSSLITLRYLFTTELSHQSQHSQLCKQTNKTPPAPTSAAGAVSTQKSTLSTYLFSNFRGFKEAATLTQKVFARFLQSL